jgi:tRNA-specific 2-thiouridylase
MEKPRRIAVGLSGGVDSAVALLLLKKQGWEPVGVSLKMAVWKGKCNSLRENSCCTDGALANARNVCRRLGVPYYIYDVRRQFEKRVMGYFLRELSAARTPNPCLVCNRDLKLRALFEWARKHGIRHVATGHYATVRNGKLLRALDMKKDQSYGLCLLPRAMLSRLVLPLGNLTKEQVYGIAIKEGLGFYRGVRQSQDLCFVSEQAMKPFLFEKLGKRPGPIVDEKWRRIGEHFGLFLYTVGQRRGLGFPSAHFVKGFDARKNALIVTRDRSRVMGREFAVENFNWLVQPPRAKRFCAMAQIRTHQLEVKAIVVRKGRALEITCAQPIEGIAPGQICALYRGNQCLGGGEIGRALG